LWLSVVALHEVAYGVARITDLSRQAALETWVNSVKARFKGRIIGIDGAIAETAGRLRGLASLRGRTLAPLDSLVAATAVICLHTLAKRNIRDFEHLDMALRNPWTV
jgi:hypothetical protein